jgi:hypothetical protein
VTVTGKIQKYLIREAMIAELEPLSRQGGDLKLFLRLLIAAPRSLVVPFAAPARPCPRRPRKFNLDTPIQELYAERSGQGRARQGYARPHHHSPARDDQGISLRQLQPYSDGKLTDELLAKSMPIWRRSSEAGAGGFGGCRDGDGCPAAAQKASGISVYRDARRR